MREFDFEGPLEELSGDWFVNRREELNLFWRWATSVPRAWQGSYALIGLRRTGKTAILYKLFNRLFYDQTEVMPIFITFARYVNRSRPIDSYEFVDEFFGGYVRCYLAFRYGHVDLIKTQTNIKRLEELAIETQDEVLLDLLYEYNLVRHDSTSSVYGLVHWTINIPRSRAFQKKMPTILIIDEFQVLTKVYNPDSQRYNAVTNAFQSSAETRWAPMLVSGSAVSLMVDDALGGMLSGRFRPHYLDPLTEEHTVEMVYRLSRRNGIEATKNFALEIWHLTKGYPYPIECLFNSYSTEVMNLPNQAALEAVLLYELTPPKGVLWSHYHREYGKYIQQLNGDQTARKVLLWLIKHPEQSHVADRIAPVLDLDEGQVRTVLEKLHEADIIHSTGWFSYEGPRDPMLRRYIGYQHKREIENLSPEAAAKDLRTEIRRVQGEANRVVEHLAEIMVGGIMRGFDNREVDGSTYFSVPETVLLPCINKLERREGVIKAGEYNEIDLIGEYRAQGNEAAWLVSVRYRQQKMGPSDIEKFLRHCEAVQTEKGYTSVTRWYFSKAGFTTPAIDLLQAEGIYYSDLDQTNALAQVFDFLGVDP